MGQDGRASESLSNPFREDLDEASERDNDDVEYAAVTVVEIDMEDLEEDDVDEDAAYDDEEDDWEVEVDEDDEESDYGDSHLRIAGLSRSINAGLVQQFPLLSECNPRGLEGDLAHELAASTYADLSYIDPLKAKEGEGADRSPRSATLNPAHALLMREGGSGGPGFSPATQAHLASRHRLPTKWARMVDCMHSRIYTGRFSQTGDIFYAGFQGGGCIKVYDATSPCFTVLKYIHARQLRWTITDTALSPDSRFLLYSSITSTVHMVDISARGVGPDAARSIGNVTDLHEALELTGARGDVDDYSTGVWSLRWSPSGEEVAAGTADCSLYIYDIAAGLTVVQNKGHNDHVNAVEYADDTGNLIYTGGDDKYVKVWDRRMLRARARTKPVGVFIGHTDGVTHIDSKGDGRFLISNSKDQSIKVWDARRMSPSSEVVTAERGGVPTFQWDYRWMEYPARDRLVTHPMDASLTSIRGHYVLNTLIRAYWSPMATTGQRYVYAGSADGIVRIFDVLTGATVAQLQRRRGGHDATVRDCSWHPTLPMLTTVDFNGCITLFEPESAVDRL